MSAVLFWSTVRGMYVPTQSDIDLMDDLAITINTMGDNDPNRLVAIANKIVEILPTLNSGSRVYYVLEWIYDTIDLVIEREREQLAIKMAMMESMTSESTSNMPDTSEDTMDMDDDMDDMDASDTMDTTDDMDDVDDMDSVDPDADMMDMDDNMDTDAPTGASIQVDLTGSNYAYSESEIYVSVWDTITVNFESTQGTHDFVIVELGVQSEIVTAADGVTSVTFTVDEAGSYEYFCSVGNHRDQWMFGSLIVE